jgi:hypothetical protein
MQIATSFPRAGHLHSYQANVYILRFLTFLLISSLQTPSASWTQMVPPTSLMLLHPLLKFLRPILL